MTPKLDGFDHVHVYVKDRARAEKWYADVMGCKPVEALKIWAVNGGPLTLEDPTKSVHLALFERDNNTGSTTIAFGTSGKEFLKWQKHFEKKGLTLRISDHDLAFSMYFQDPDENMYEITTYEHGIVRERLNHVRSS